MLERAILVGCFPSPFHGDALLDEVAQQCPSMKEIYVSPATMKNFSGEKLLTASYNGAFVQDQEPRQLWGLPTRVERGEESYTLPKGVAAAKKSLNK